MKVNSKDFRVSEGEKLKLEKWPTQITSVFESKDDYHDILEKRVNELSDLQRIIGMCCCSFFRAWMLQERTVPSGM